LNALKLDFTHVTGEGLVQLPYYNNITLVSVIGSPADDLDGDWYRRRGFRPPENSNR
jgi:hypothetical protein